MALLAKSTAEVVSSRFAAVLPASKGKNVPPPPPAKVQELAAFAPVLEKGLFGRATQGSLTPLAAPQGAKAEGGGSAGDLMLLGTAVGSFRETFALVLRNSTREERVFRLGDTVFGVGRLTAVQKERAFLSVAGQQVVLSTPTAAPESAKPAAPTAGGLATQVGSGSFVVDQRALNAALDNISQAMTDARLLPSLKDGKVEGFKVSEVKPAGIFGMVGIKNGDVLLRINDFPIDSPDKAMQGLVSLKGQNRLRLDLVRDGQPATFTYDIR